MSNSTTALVAVAGGFLAAVLLPTIVIGGVMGIKRSDEGGSAVGGFVGMEDWLWENVTY